MDKRLNKVDFPKWLAVKDLNLSSYLMASAQVSLIKTERTSDGTVHFYFSPPEKTQKLIDDYWQDQGPLVPARMLFGAQRDLKDLIFSGGYQ